MYRVLAAAAAALMLAGCGMTSYSLSSGFANSSQPSAWNFGQKPASNQETASLDVPARKQDKAPKGTFEKAPTGALADRDYSHTQLDPDKARELINGYRRQKGLKPLKLNASLSDAAKAHARDLAKWDRISH